MAKGKNFFYRINPNEVLAELAFIEDREEFFLQFFNDLRNDDPDTAKIELAANIIREAHEFRVKRSKAGKASVEQKRTYAQHMLPSDEQVFNNAQPVAVAVTEAVTKPLKDKVKRFVPPSLQEVETYILESEYHVDAQKWFSYYLSNGWRVGKNKMVDWQAAVRTWDRGNGNGQSSTSGITAQTGRKTGIIEANGAGTNFLD